MCQCGIYRERRRAYLGELFRLSLSLLFSRKLLAKLRTAPARLSFALSHFSHSSLTRHSTSSIVLTAAPPALRSDVDLVCLRVQGIIPYGLGPEIELFHMPFESPYSEITIESKSLVTPSPTKK